MWHSRRPETSSTAALGAADLARWSCPADVWLQVPVTGRSARGWPVAGKMLARYSIALSSSLSDAALCILELPSGARGDVRPGYTVLVKQPGQRDAPRFLVELIAQFSHASICGRPVRRLPHVRVRKSGRRGQLSLAHASGSVVRLRVPRASCRARAGAGAAGWAGNASEEAQDLVGRRLWGVGGVNVTGVREITSRAPAMLSASCAWLPRTPGTSPGPWPPDARLRSSPVPAWCSAHSATRPALLARI